MNEWYHMNEEVLPHKWMNESYHTNRHVSSHTWKSPTTYMKEYYHINERVIPHEWMHHVTGVGHVWEYLLCVCRCTEWAEHRNNWMSRVAWMNESCHRMNGSCHLNVTCLRTPSTCAQMYWMGGASTSLMSHVTWMNGSCHWNVTCLRTPSVCEQLHWLGGAFTSLMSHVTWMSESRHMNECFVSLECDMSENTFYVCIGALNGRSIYIIDESRHTNDLVMSHEWMGHVAGMWHVWEHLLCVHRCTE